ncbi:host attachment protein [Nodosilinea sp. P-1105]|uniref:host attachment protein n=1 Tax=Nodosilinea sp. P-1105 TaxID=2546229 RepID=UPI00146A06CF|nr:host attachment protein [Nodosilinea sp. P-1105]NMF85241.1 host attachment protein [Nodosilinea sp. P-1105]
MTRFLVATVDGARASFLTLEPLIAPEFESGPDLIERCTLANPALEMAGQELWANSKTGRNRSSGSKGHNYDDHRNNHLVEFERRFAQAIVSRMDELIAEYSLNTVILVAEPQILGILRETLHSSNGRSVQIHDMAKDLCWMKPRQLHDYLAQKDLLPAHQVAMTGSRAR